MNFRDDDDKREPLSLFSQSALTDVVMLLLIFFLLTSSFVTNFGIQVEIPDAETGTQTDSQFITVSITEEGNFYVEGEQVTRGQLTAEIRKAQSDQPQASLVLRADENAIIDNAVRVMNIANALDLKIILATEQSTQ